MEDLHLNMLLNLFGLILSYVFVNSTSKNVNTNLISIQFLGKFNQIKLLSLAIIVIVFTMTLFTPIVISQGLSTNFPIIVVSMFLVRIVTEISSINHSRNSKRIFHLQVESVLLSLLLLSVYISFDTIDFNSIMRLTFGTTSISFITKIAKLNTFFIILLLILRLRDYDSLHFQNKRTTLALDFFWIHILKTSIIVLAFEGAIPFEFFEKLFQGSVIMSSISSIITFIMKYIMLELIIKTISFAIPKKTPRIAIMNHEKIFVIVAFVIITMQVWLEK